MKKAVEKLVVVLIVMLSFKPALAQKEKFHSVFLYSFSKYVKWPQSEASSKFVIGVMGNSSIMKHLEDMASSKKINGMSIEIKRYSSADEIEGCHILYVTSGEGKKIEQISLVTKDQSILIVTNDPGLARRGAAINFVEVDDKVKFELNQKNAEIRGLKVAGALAGLAIEV